MEVDAAQALCPDCPPIVPAAPPEAEEREGKPVSEVRAPYSRLPAASTAAFRQSRDAVGRATTSHNSSGRKKEERPADKGRRLGKRSPGSNTKDWKRHKRFSSEASTPTPTEESASSSSSSSSSGVETSERDVRTAGSRERGALGGGEPHGRAAAMADLYEHRGGNGGLLQWLKDRLSNILTSNKYRNDGREPMDWEGMD